MVPTNADESKDPEQSIPLLEKFVSQGNDDTNLKNQEDGDMEDEEA